MKVGLLLLILWAAGSLGRRARYEETTLTGKKVTDESSLSCRLDMLRSYLLKGRYEPSETDPLLLCPGVKHNCCTKADQQRIFHIVSDILPPKILNYEERIKSALSALLKFHNHVVQNPPQFVGSPARQDYCRRQARFLYSFPLASMITRIFDLIQSVNEEMRTYYRRFYCVLCDGANHPSFVSSGKTHRVIFDGAFCQATLNSREELINTLNVHLVAYLVNLQNVVDCKHYVRSFNLDFFSREAISHTVSLVSCLDFIQGKDFIKFCRPTCGRLNLARVSTLLQGDLDFLLDALNLFKRSFEVRESGNFVSPRVRQFFKSQVVGVDDATLATRKLVVRRSSKDLSIGKKFRKLSQTQLEKAANLFRELAKRSATENLAHEAAQRLHKTAVPAKVKTLALRTDSGVDSGRVLAVQTPADTSQKSAGSPATNKQEESTKGPSKPLLFMDARSKETYSLIHIERKGQPHRHVFRVQPPPLDFDSCTKVFQSRGGVNPELYNDNAFDMSPRLFYLRLYGDHRQETPSTALRFLLSDFTDESLEAVHKELRESFRIDPDNWVSLEHSVLGLSGP